MFQTAEFRSVVSRSYPASWEVDKDFVALNFDQIKGGVCVRVSVLRLEFPKHSYSIGWKYPSGELKFHFQTDQQVDANLIQSLLESAQAHVKAEVMVVTEARAKKDAERQKIIDEDKAKKTAKKKQYEANVEQRRVENRSRSQGGSGGGGKNKK